MLKHKKLGVIFIDCWDQDWKWQPTNNFYANLKNTLSQYTIDRYVFHTGFLSLDYITNDVANYFKEFIVDQPESIQRRAVADFIQGTGTERLTPELFSIIDNNKTIFIPTFNGFKQWAQTAEIGQWIVVGAHWGICTHTKPLGFDNLLEYKKQYPGIRIFSIPTCTAKWVNGPECRIVTTCINQDYINDRHKWQYCGEDLYELTI